MLPVCSTRGAGSSRPAPSALGVSDALAAASSPTRTRREMARDQATRCPGSIYAEICRGIHPRSLAFYMENGSKYNDFNHLAVFAKKNQQIVENRPEKKNSQNWGLTKNCKNLIITAVPGGVQFWVFPMFFPEKN